MRVLIFGASGMVGQGVLRESLRDLSVTEVVTVLRAPSGKHDLKMTEIVLADMFAIADIADRLNGFDACFFCLGVSSLGMSEAAYTAVTHDLTILAAKVLAPRNPLMTFIYVTGTGTDRDSRQMWARVKARTEDELASLSFKAVYFFRPGFIQPLHGVTSKTRWYMTIYAITKPLLPFLVPRFPNLATTTERLGRAMLNVAASGYKAPVLTNADINAVAVMD